MASERETVVRLSKAQRAAWHRFDLATYHVLDTLRNRDGVDDLIAEFEDALAAVDPRTPATPNAEQSHD